MSINILFLQAFIFYNLNVNWLFQASEEPEFYLAPQRSCYQILLFLGKS